jgi:hypothetical protein
MANTTSAKKATRKIARRTIVNEGREGSNEARRACPHEGGPAQHRSQEPGQPQSLAPEPSDREARSVSDTQTTISESPAFAPGFLFASDCTRHTPRVTDITHSDDEPKNLDDAQSL